MCAGVGVVVGCRAGRVVGVLGWMGEEVGGRVSADASRGPFNCGSWDGVATVPLMVPLLVPLVVPLVVSLKVPLLVPLVPLVVSLKVPLKVPLMRPLNLRGAR